MIISWIYRATLFLMKRKKSDIPIKKSKIKFKPELIIQQVNETDSENNSELTLPSNLIISSLPEQIEDNKSLIEKTYWFIVSASVIGKSHLKSNIPCQDNHHWESIDRKSVV